MNELIEVTVKHIHESGYFMNTRTKIPKNLASVLQGLHKMCNDGIFKYKPHLEQKRDIYTLCIDTYGVSDDIVKQVKQIAINKGCDVKINSCYHWLSISNQKENINKYFE